jgi:biopolymer transport protein ExbD
MARSRFKESIEINLIPYIDILLVLVLILMLTSTLSYQAHNIQLPSTHGQEVGTSSNQHHITLDRDLMVGLTEDGSPTTLGMLGKMTVDDLLTLDPKQTYTIDADSSLSYQYIVDLLTLLKTAGFTKVALGMQS